MKKSLLLTGVAILLFGTTQKFDGQENSQSHRQKRIGCRSIIDRQSKIAQAPFFSRQEPNSWTTDHNVPDKHLMTKPLGQQDFRTNAKMTAKTIAQHEFSAGVDTAWVRRYGSGLAPGEDAATAIAVDGSGNIYVTGSGVSFLSGHDYLTVKYHSSGTQLWVARYNGPENTEDYATAIAVDASGNVYVTGGSGTVKYNSEGIQQWVARYNGGHWAAALAVDPSGNVYVTGGSYSSGTEMDFTTIKYNSEGVEQWVARYNSPANLCDEARALAVDASGNVYVTGEAGSLTTGSDFATIKYNSAGIQQWVARYNGPGNSNDGANSLVVDASGNVYMTGGSVGSGTGGDFATVKYNADGVQQWVARYNGPANASEWAIALAMDDSGNVYVTGDSYGLDTKTDFATVKYNSEGVEQWVARYNAGENSMDYVNALAVDGFGNVYVTGCIGGDYNYDYAIVKYNSDSVELWLARYNGPENYGDYAAALAVDASGNVYVTGYTGFNESYEYTGGPKSSDYATIKYNSSGIEQWIARYNGQGNCWDFSTCLAVDASGNVYVTGESWVSGTESDYATVKYNSDGVELWLDRYNGPGNLYDEASALAVDGSGNIYVTGWSRGSGTESDYATVKYNSDGIKQWVVRYNGTDGATALAVDSYGNVYVTGESAGDFTTIKYNSNGIELWVARSNGGSWASALAVDAYGNVYVTGWSWDSGTKSDYATVKYNSDGIEQWIARYNGLRNDYDYAYALAVDNSCNVYVTGESGGYYATIKYNSAGVQQWAARYNEPGSWGARANSIAVDSSGNIYVTGCCGGWDTYSDFTTIKYTSAGVQQWVARYTGGEAVALALDTFGNIYVTGSSEFDYTTVKYNSAGVEQWIARYNGPGNLTDIPTALAIDGSGNVFVTGSSIDNEGDRIYTTIKYIQTTTVSLEKDGSDSPSRYWLAQNYPNPFNPSTTIEFALPQSAFVTLKIYNLLGEEVATLIAEQRAAGIHKFNWDARGLGSGVYLYRLEAGEFVQVKKLVLMR